MTTATHKLVITGDTKPSKEVLKKAGWKWNPVAQNWSMQLVTAHADRVKSGDTEFSFGSLKINRKGCQVTLDGIVVWTSKTFGQTAAPIAGDIYNCDQFGNAVVAKRIPGSAPDDMI